MELYNALKKVVELQTEDILKDVKLINILSDFKAYDEMPSSKYLLKYMINEGLMANLLFEYQPQKDLELFLSSQIKLISDTYGYKEDLTEYVIRSLAYGLGWIHQLPTMSDDTSIIGSNSLNNQSTIPPVITEDGKKHISFRQLPINGPVDQYIKNLESIGYMIKQSYSSESHVCILGGSFAGVNNCEIYVVGTPLTHIVCRVIVYFQEQSVWYNIKSEYNKWKEKFTTKYGEPRNYEFFTDPYYEGDGSEMTALFAEHCTYASYFTDNESGGIIAVKMTKYKCVCIIYEDKINTELEDKEINDIENNEI